MTSDSSKAANHSEAERIQALADDIERDKIRQAVAQDPGRKLMAGAELYDLARSFMLAGIRMQNPHADEQEVRRLARQRLNIGRKNDENGFLFDRYLQSLARDGEPK